VVETLAVGKLDMEFLAALLEQYAHTDDERVVVGPRVGEDALVVDFGDRLLVAKTDPITFATDEIGWYAVNVNANDIATTGATCRWFLATLLLPEGRTTKQLVETIFAQLSQACRSLDIALCGGHTEITYGLDRPIVIGQMLGEVERDALVTTDGMRVGDDLILTKGIAIEGTAIIAREKADALANTFPPEFIARCQGFLHDPGISVVAEARLATTQARIHAMHDPTEGGVATGLRELALASWTRPGWTSCLRLPSSAPSSASTHWASSLPAPCSLPWLRRIRRALSSVYRKRGSPPRSSARW